MASECGSVLDRGSTCRCPAFGRATQHDGFWRESVVSGWSAQEASSRWLGSPSSCSPLSGEFTLNAPRCKLRTGGEARHDNIPLRISACSSPERTASSPAQPGAGQVASAVYVRRRPSLCMAAAVVGRTYRPCSRCGCGTMPQCCWRTRALRLYMWMRRREGGTPARRQYRWCVSVGNSSQS
jgi:hypothetical protein